jgi:hypothetical protein
VILIARITPLLIRNLGAKFVNKLHSTASKNNYSLSIGRRKNYCCSK